MTALGGRLAVLDTTMVCDGPGQHDLRVVTDGRVFYAYGLGSRGAECPLASRNGTVIEVTCAQPLPHDERCDGFVRVDLAAGGTWTGDPEPMGLLDQYAQEVDR